MNLGAVKAWQRTARNLGLNIRAARLELRWTQEELGWQAGLHRTYIADVEAGKRNISLGSIQRLADGLGCGIRDLFPADKSAARATAARPLPPRTARKDPA